MRVFASVWMILITIALGKLVGDWTSAIATISQRRTARRLLSQSITADLFRDIDVNKDNSIDRYEFLCAMLLRLDKVEQADIDQISKAFDARDKDHDGKLDMHETSKPAT
mmetsp:Transcript_5830/g.10308  ORF Transcript_5830/g.10308 Transcript_5830/m.10308 type:complete len:110 (+) Transcript_5830:1-330(+)